MPPKISLGINLSKPNKLAKSSPFGVQSKPLAAGQKRKKTVFGDSDSESDRVELQANNKQNGAIEITTLGGLGDEEENNKHEDFTPRKVARTTPQLGGAKPALKVKSLKSSIFDDENDEGQQQGVKETKTYGLQKPAAAAGPTEPEYKNLAALHTSRKHAQQAEEIDPSIYSYDAVYDTIKAKRENKKKSTNEEGDEGEGSSKYMSALMRTAEIRKRDQLRARDRLLAKEREAEGDEFADKEKFVTAAYRAQQEEVKRMEEEEARREKEEEERRRRNGDSGMMGFYRQMLARDEESHGEVMKATEEAARKVAAGEVVESEEQQDAKEKSEAQIAAELNARGSNIVVNDEGQIVDKRQLLSAGLNVAPKPKAKLSDAARAASVVRPGARPGGPSREVFASREAQRARQTEMIAAQLEEKARQEEEADQARQKELAEKTKSRKTETDVSSARERYLARKREREAAQNKG
ncbi:uncharacterized protein BHQ10_007121 [Talaromyces amestolkiae]|uniref:Nuclear speckle splicing regulatory protein 1 N-terminal domain-containing protein n=1 Tax=Talaromyces amestolkiae TaxID=1196081 RepID=A0A364L5P5_TALAM|nr:uncharacterized protein BHQ10_007121 [Talaromyces amestolkiae]RAO71109.1 hypothetical protein BHQ10_007121 [Talaromyces amestolkiae]